MRLILWLLAMLIPSIAQAEGIVSKTAPPGVYSVTQGNCSAETRVGVGLCFWDYIKSLNESWKTTRWGCAQAKTWVGDSTSQYPAAPVSGKIWRYVGPNTIGMMDCTGISWFSGAIKVTQPPPQCPANSQELDAMRCTCNAGYGPDEAEKQCIPLPACDAGFERYNGECRAVCTDGTHRVSDGSCANNCTSPAVWDSAAQRCTCDSLKNAQRKTGAISLLATAAVPGNDSGCAGGCAVVNTYSSPQTYLLAGVKRVLYQASSFYTGATTMAGGGSCETYTPPENPERIVVTPAEPNADVAKPADTCAPGYVLITRIDGYKGCSTGTGEVVVDNTTPIWNDSSTTKTTNADGSTTETTTTKDSSGRVTTTTVNRDASGVIVGANTTSTGGPAPGSAESGNDIAEYCKAHPDAALCGKEPSKGEGASVDGLYEKTSGDKTFASSLNNFKGSVLGSPFVSAASSYFAVTIPTGTCGGLAVDVPMIGGTTWHLDASPYLCGPDAQALYRFLEIGFMLLAAGVAFAIAFL